MTRFLDKSFSVYSGSGERYRDNWDRIFKKDPEPKEETPDAMADTERSPDRLPCGCTGDWCEVLGAQPWKHS